MRFDVNAVRTCYPALNGQVHGRPLVYLDNAATAQMPACVMEAVQRLELRRGNVHRGIHALSEECTAAYEAARSTVAEFLCATPEQITFTAGTTDGINRVADSLTLSPRDAVVVTQMEHHSNFVPWQQLCRRTGAEFRVAPLTESGELDWAAMERFLTPNVRLVAVAQSSNVLGTVNDIPRLARLTHAIGGELLVDGAQGICHEGADMTHFGCDYYAFSGHKLGAPFGIGALYSRNPMPLVRYGGGMVERVTETQTTFASAPLGGEAGTPNVSGAVGLAEAIRFRKNLPNGWQSWESALLNRLETGLSQMERVSVLGAPRHRSGCIFFSVDDAAPFDLAVLLDQLGFAVRSGHHCAQPLLHSLGLEYALRVSPAFYNTPEEIDSFLAALERVIDICVK